MLPVDYLLLGNALGVVEVCLTFCWAFRKDDIHGPSDP